ncbi:MAG: hypothetical protein NTZ78_03325 [Candidatus Aureabacteria bacterium]|nr:hypothetical protein [Candidatus Auribacterota bacterium]
MKRLMTVMISVIFAACMAGMAIAGSIDSPGAPSAGSGMYTLQNLYDYLTSGTALTAQTGFQEPIAAPGSTMKTTKEIGDTLKSLYEQCPATADNVESGVKFFCTQSGRWGVQTGTALLMPTPTPTQTPTVTPIPWGPTPCAAKAGYWTADGLGGSGCWFQTGEQVDCTDKCVSVGLVCASRQWNGGDSCEICKHFYPSAGNCAVQNQSFQPCYWAQYNECDSRVNGDTHLSCGTEGPYNRFCVCE